MATAKSREDGGKSQIDRKIAALADRQHGVVALWQLLELGLGRDAIQYRVSVGRLHRIHHGVYAVGYRKLTPRGHRMAAVLAYGPEALAIYDLAAHRDVTRLTYRIEDTDRRELIDIRDSRARYGAPAAGDRGAPAQGGAQRLPRTR